MPKGYLTRKYADETPVMAILDNGKACKGIVKRFFFKNKGGGFYKILKADGKHAYIRPGNIKEASK